jgi:hypothetical protein
MEVVENNKNEAKKIVAIRNGKIVNLIFSSPFWLNEISAVVSATLLYKT